MIFPKISIITPSFNQGDFIEETILSVIEQGYPNLEYIILDGGSTDQTLEVIRKYEKHITFWKSEKDKGQSDAINKGFRLATGDIINWLNSDDYYEKGCLFKVAEAFKKPEVKVYCGISRVFGIGESYLNNGSDVYPDNLAKTVGMSRIDQPETFFRHSMLKEINYLNDFLHYTMDKEMWMRYLLKNGLQGICKTSELLVHYRLHPSSKTVSLQQGFKNETHSIYYTYAKWFELNQKAAFLANNFSVKELPLQHYDGLLNKEKAALIVNYYFFQQALISYAQNNYSISKGFISHIDKKIISEEERVELNTLGMRMRFPVVLKKIFNSIKAVKKG